MNIKEKIICFVSRYQYPQYVFSQAIKKYLQKKLSLSNYKIIDVPCGNGETAYNLSFLPNAKIYGYDVSSNAISLAKKHFSRKNVFFETADIHTLFTGNLEFNIICIINSLFLLSSPENILNSINSKMKNTDLLFIITPNISGKNYYEFKKIYPDVNLMEYSFAETKSFFEKQGFVVQYSEGIAKIPLYGKRELKFLSVFSPFYLLILNFIAGIFYSKRSNYFLFALAKK